MWKLILAVAVGSALGGLLRWGLAVKLNSLSTSILPGTLAANLIAAYIVGIAITCFASSHAISHEWRLLIITGFCGGLSTFSTFSAEITTLLQQHQTLWAMAAIAAHVGGSLLMTFAGIATASLLKPG